MEDELLTLLSETDGFISGEQLSDRLGITRSAVWKRINRLREKGYTIDSVTNKGYRLLKEERGELYGKRLKEAFDEIPGDFWKTMIFKDVIDSSNLECKRYIQEHPGCEGVVVFCEQQTAGRGRRGRTWVSPPGSGIYMSMIIQPDFPASKAPMMTLLAGMAVRRSIEEVYGISPSIKWPNDIILSDRKVCGILTEMTMEDMTISGVVIGIGINVNNNAFGEELKEVATSIAMETGTEQPDRAALAVKVLEWFEVYLNRFRETQDLSGVMEEYNAHCINTGKRVRVLLRDGEYEALARGIRPDGELEVKLDDGTITGVSSGEVTIRGVMGYAK